MENFSVTEWKALFQEVGLTPAAMEKWHQLFESRHPAAHQSFLEWLGVDAAKIKAIRSK